MSFEEYDIFFIDDYILGRNEDNELLSLIEHHFREKQLTFSLLEMVLLKEHGIGETHIFAEKDLNKDNFYNKYYALVDDFKNKFEGGVSAYKEWYEKKTWIFIGKGAVSNISYKVINYKWKPRNDARDMKQYGEKSGLTKQIVLDYFNAYAEAIGELELKKHPHYFIIIHPVYKPDKDKAIPYGNLYLHFATLNEVDLETIQDFFRKFMLIWYKYYGGLNHGIVINGLVKEVTANPEIAKYIPAKFGGHKTSLEILFARYFWKEGNVKKFAQKVDAFFQYLDEIKNGSIDNIRSKKIGIYLDAPSFKDLLIDYSEEAFENFIFKRAVAIFLFVARGFSIMQIRREIMGYHKENNEERDSTGSKFLYFYQCFHLPFHARSNEELVRNKLKKGYDLSLFEKEIINKYSTSPKL